MALKNWVFTDFRYLKLLKPKGSAFVKDTSLYGYALA